MKASLEWLQEYSDIDVFLNEDIETYLRDLHRIYEITPHVIGLQSTNGTVAARVEKSLKAYCLAHEIRLIKFHEQLSEDVELENDLISIAQNDIKIQGFTNFRTIKFYKNPDFDKEI